MRTALDVMKRYVAAIIFAIALCVSASNCHAQDCGALAEAVENWENNVAAAIYWHDLSVDIAAFYFSIGDNDSGEEWAMWAEVWNSLITQYGQSLAEAEEDYENADCAP